MDTGIELRHVSKTYRTPSLLPWRPRTAAIALTDVSFACPAGKTTCLLGPNGSGKTTIVKILAGLVVPDAGDALIGGEQPVRRHAVRIGLATSNERSFYWRLTGRQNLEFFASLHGVKGQSMMQGVRDALEMTGLSAQADKPVRQYSSGMKQRLLVARALLGDPQVVLLDEPTAHLDHPGRKAIHSLVRDTLIGRRGLTVLVCTNDLAEAKGLAENLILLDKGAVIADGPLSVFQSKLHEQWRLRMSFERPPRPGWAAGFALDPPPGDGKEIECGVSSPDLVADIVDAAVAGGGRVLACSCSQPSLEEIFDRLVEEKK